VETPRSQGAATTVSLAAIAPPALRLVAKNQKIGNAEQNMNSIEPETDRGTLVALESCARN